MRSLSNYDDFCIDGASIQFLSGITLAFSTINIFIFLFDLYVKYENMTAKKQVSFSKTVTEANDDEEEANDDEEEANDDDEEEANDDEEVHVEPEAVEAAETVKTDSM
jgi:hypothetical protein